MTSSPTPTAADTTVDTTKVLKAMPGLVFIFVFGILCLQAFNFVFADIGADLGAPEQASLITAIPGVVLGIACVIYGSLGDFVSLRRLMLVGLVLIVVGSVLGLLSGSSIWLVIIARAIQTAGCQVAGSVYLVVATKYAPGAKKVIYFGVFTAAYQFSTAVGIVAAGQLSRVNWTWLFIIPLLSLFFAPSLLANLPDVRGRAQRIDVIGFVIAGFMVGSLVIFFSTQKWWLLGLFVVLLVVFGAYIAKAKDPFVSPAFFANRRYLMAVSLILVFYLGQYAMNPLFNSVGAALYGRNTMAMSFVLLWANLVGGATGMLSGRIVGWIGRGPGILLAGILMALSAFLAAFTLESGIWAIGLSAIFFFAGLAMMYSPVVDTVVGTVDVSESGRAVGLNDLAMNVSPSIGVAIFGALMSSSAFAQVTVTGASAGQAAHFSVIFLILGAISVAGVVWFLVVRRHLYADAWGRASAQE
ncbi:MFS transporter [Corynebacterium uberis]|uniref:MFS transporter n=1 Tax=Corynebacterium TaxID=1716 RepID=UPI001D0A1152|nr:MULTISPECIES: MFS transporter [Corynebacterium]MCZ9308462.1 MFS transporter [Corynebacterium sp. c6VSa_13]UDL74126.1 MFS transporter [Corynebacterium uberis]UDL74990.1 MFS transporter [Corynebacterium uberis]UDL77205.1 MFS transporter [Corynebacterium uberis]UDL79487.1 MFS transporter [Corynebacterium uberis]